MQRPEEWKLEQGLAPRDGGIDTENVASFESISVHNKEHQSDCIDPSVDFAEEFPGRHGCIE